MFRKLGHRNVLLAFLGYKANETAKARVSWAHLEIIESDADFPQWLEHVIETDIYFGCVRNEEV